MRPMPSCLYLIPPHKAGHRHIQTGTRVQTIRQLKSLRATLEALKAGGRTVAMVPTMGALHPGHMTLVERAKQVADHVVVSIFVNPKQFGPNEDLSRYPRQEAEDSALLEAAGVDVLWLPPVEEIYPDGYATTVSVARLGDRLCGAARPGHFDGVSTVVAKLFTQVRPDFAVFGEKDWQQLAVIRRMAIDLNLGVEIIGAPTERDADGLALSSRNAYLTAAERVAALALPTALQRAAAEIAGGGVIGDALVEARDAISAAGFGPIDYVELVDAASLEPLEMLDREGRILAAARIGITRLIDNFAVIPAPRRKK
jgi:pantoate--beta-alanine ligase